MPAGRQGAEDLRRAADQLAARLPYALSPLARVAYNYRWSWLRGGDAIFERIDPYRWEMCGRNPVRLLQETSTAALERAAGDAELTGRGYRLEERIAAESAESPAALGFDGAEPRAFFCAEYGIHPSLPIYAGGLGVLAGDLLKAASDACAPMVGIGLLYRKGYFRQRMDVAGGQQEYWVDSDPERLPAALVCRNGGEPLTLSVSIRGRDVVAQIWRVDVGRVPLFLLDADRLENSRVDRWITARLYDGDRDTRLAQYALLGIGGMRALAALGIDPAVVHLNEGHAALAPLELAAMDVARGVPLEQALEAARKRTVFTTHTPVPAGNEAYPQADVARVISGLPQRLGSDWETLFEFGRTHPEQRNEPVGMTQLGLRLSRSANGVSKRHGAIARAMWRPLFGAGRDEDVPIRAVTNGVHLPTWMAEPMRELFEQQLGEDWELRSEDPDTWARFDALPDASLWTVRCALRAALVEQVRDRATLDRLSRGEAHEYVEMAARAFDPNVLTVGFARRLATYKRLHLISHRIERALQLLRGDRPIQILLAGKAHPQDEGAKNVVRALFRAKGSPYVGERIAYLHDYDIQVAKYLVAGCDVWLNLPRPPLEASGTSGMKAALNGALNLSVLDGWWHEAYDGNNGFAIEGEVDPDEEAQDARHAAALLDLLEHRIVPLYYERDAEGIPREWIRLVRASIRTAARHFTSRRMLSDYATRVYA